MARSKKPALALIAIVATTCAPAAKEFIVSRDERVGSFWNSGRLIASTGQSSKNDTVALEYMFQNGKMTLSSLTVKTNKWAVDLTPYFADIGRAYPTRARISVRAVSTNGNIERVGLDVPFDVLVQDNEPIERNCSVVSMVLDKGAVISSIKLPIDRNHCFI